MISPTRKDPADTADVEERRKLQRTSRMRNLKGRRPEMPAARPSCLHSWMNTSLNRKFTLGQDSLVLLTLDSCRWDSYDQANTPRIDCFGLLQRAYTQATFTYPAHLAFFQGILPIAPLPLPFYNRFVAQLIRISRRPTKVPSLVRFPQESNNIITALRELGYFAFGAGAVEWFRHKDLTSSFDSFFFTGIHAVDQTARLISAIEGRKEPFFGFINFGETHYPYEFSDRGVKARHRRASAWTRSNPIPSFDEEEWRKQVRCVEYLDHQIGALLEWIDQRRAPTLVVICGDHGECFGEDGLSGHGFYHSKVMEVPLGIFWVGA